MEAILDKLNQLRIIPVIAIERSEDAIPLGKALIDGGLPIIEITFRTEAAEMSIRALAESNIGLTVGAGTVVAVSQAERAVEAGAHFIVSPGFSPSVVRWCLDRSLPVFPGIATSTEIIQALDYGIHIVKFFPAEALGGSKMLKALSAPFHDVRFIPTGGIQVTNLAEYLNLPCVQACGGSWLAPRKLIAQRDFAEITRLTSEAMQIVQQVLAKGSAT